MTNTRPLLISMSEIASLAKVKRPVVTTWLRRHRDFPVPIVDQSGMRRFHGREVVAWLITKGLGNADPAQLTEELVLHSMVAQADSFGPGYLTQLLGSLLCLRHLSEKPLLAGGQGRDSKARWDELQQRARRMDADDEFVLRELLAADNSVLPLAELADELTEAAYSAHAAYEWLLASRDRLGVAMLTKDALAPVVLDLVSQIADVGSRFLRGQSQVTIADPHVRAGDLLAALLRRPDEPGNLQALAADPEDWLARLTRRRLLLGGIEEVGLDVQTGSDLEERMGSPDVIVTRLPYHPSEDRSALRALDEVEGISDLLGPGCTAVAIGPADALVGRIKETEAAQRRSALIRSGLVEAVVNLPGGSFPFRPGYPSAMWVLTRDPIPTARGYVLLADISSEPMNGRVQTQLGQDILLWRAEGRHRNAHDPRFGRIVPIGELERDIRGPLWPSRPPISQGLARAVLERPALISEAERRLEQAVGQAEKYATERGSLHSDVVQRDDGPVPTITIGDLIKSERAAVFRGHRIDPADLGSGGHHKVLGVEEVCAMHPVGARFIDRAVFADKYEHAAFTAPGDIIYATGFKLSALVDHDGFSLAVFPARVLRLLAGDRHKLTPRVLAALLGAARDTRRSPRAVRASRRIEDVAIPDLVPADVARLDALLADVERRQELLRAQDDALSEICALTVAGFADGMLTIDKP